MSGWRDGRLQQTPPVMSRTATHFASYGTRFELSRTMSLLFRARATFHEREPAIRGRQQEMLTMARHYSEKAQASVKRAMHELKRGELKSGKSGKKVTNPKQAIAIGLSEARQKGAKVPSKAGKK
jgi:hypothetical protein